MLHPIRIVDNLGHLRLYSIDFSRCVNDWLGKTLDAAVYPRHTGP